MLNELTNYCQPDLNTVLFGIPESDFHTNLLFGIPESDFHTNYSIIVTVQKYIFYSKRFER